MGKAIEAGHGEEDLAATFLAHVLERSSSSTSRTTSHPAVRWPCRKATRSPRKINALAASGDYDLVVATRDWHPADHSSFAAQGGPWPVHCVAGTPGRRAAPGARPRRRSTSIVDKGQAVDTDGYSGFEGTDLEQLLRERGITQVTVVGLATDYCVKNTALDALRAGFRSPSTAARSAASRSSRATPSARWPRCAPPAA